MKYRSRFFNHSNNCPVFCLKSLRQPLPEGHSSNLFTWLFQTRWTCLHRRISKGNFLLQTYRPSVPANMMSQRFWLRFKTKLFRMMLLYGLNPLVAGSGCCWGILFSQSALQRKRNCFILLDLKGSTAMATSWLWQSGYQAPFPKVRNSNDRTAFSSRTPVEEHTYQLAVCWLGATFFLSFFIEKNLNIFFVRATIKLIMPKSYKPSCLPWVQNFF